MRAYVSDEMLAETSRTTTPLDDAGSSAPGSAGCAERADQERDHGRDGDGGERKPQPPDGRRSPLERGTVAEWDRGRRHRYAPPPAPCSTRSASVVASGGPGSGRDQATPAAVRASSGSPTTREARLAARRRSSASRVADSRRSLTARSRVVDASRPTRIGPRSRRSGAVSTIAPTARRPTPRRRAAPRRARARRDTSDSGRLVWAPERRLGRLDRRGGHARPHCDLDAGRDGDLAARRDAGPRQRDGCSALPLEAGGGRGTRSSPSR